MASLKDKTISGIFWSFLQKVGARGISFMVMILLARLLTPEDFGLIGMLMIFIQISQAIVEGGFKLALIQKKDADEYDFSSVFWINLTVSIILYGIVFFLAPFIGNFYNQPILSNLIQVLAVVFVVNAFSLVQEARLTKEIKFKTLMLVNIPSYIIGGGISVVMAVYEFGVWSLVAYQLVSRVAYAIQIWVYAKWRPLIFLKWNRIGVLFSFGGKLLISKIVGVIYNNIFLVVIGKFYPARSVGFYQNSFMLVNMPAGTITSVLTEVTFPAFSSIQNDDKKLKTGYKRVMQQAFFWICPAFVFAGVLALPLFEFVFGSNWIPAVPYFRWLCVTGIFLPLNTYNLNIVNVKGRSDIFLRLQLTRRIITIVAIIAVFPLGITALLITQAASSVFTFCLFGYYSGKFIKYPMGEQLGDVLPIFLLSTVMGAIIYSINQYMIPWPNIVQLLLGLIIGFCGYLLAAHYFKMSPWNVFKQILQQKLLSKLNSRSE